MHAARRLEPSRNRPVPGPLTRSRAAGRTRNEWVLAKQCHATRRLPPNTHIVTYDGEKLTDAQLDQRYGTDDNGGHAPYGLKVTQPSAQHRGKTVDSACQRSLASIINGSRTRSLSNVRYSNSARADGSIKVFTRNRAIQPGTELLAWYRQGYWASAAKSRHTTR